MKIYLAVMVAIQLLDILILFFCTTNTKFKIKEKTFIYLITCILAFSLGVFIGSWNSIIIAIFLLIVLYFKNNRKLIMWDYFSILYALIIHILLAYLIVSILNFNIVTSTTTPTPKNITITMLLSISPALINYIILYFFKKYYIRKYVITIYDISKRMMIILISCLILMYILIYAVIDLYNKTTNINTTQQLILIISSILFIVIFVFIFLNQIYNEKKSQDEIRNNEYNELLNYSKQVEAMYDKVSGFQHDYINILLSLENSINEGDIVGIKEVYNTVIVPTKKDIYTQNSVLVKLRKIKVKEIKSILSAKVILAQTKNIDVTIELVSDLKTTYMDRLSLLRILSILLDNAIEASYKSSSKKIDIVIIEDIDIQIFEIRNSYLDKVNLKLMKDKNYTSKKNGGGKGLFIVDEILKNENYVVMESTQYPKEFSQKLIIKKSGEQNEYNNFRR